MEKIKKKDKFLKILMKYPDATSPAALGINSDTIVLTLAVGKMNFYIQ